MKAKIAYIALALMLSFSLAAVIVPAGTAKAATLCVNPGGTGGCYASIQAAVDDAGSGDTIVVAAGTYNENVIVSVANLTLQGANEGKSAGNEPETRGSENGGEKW